METVNALKPRRVIIMGDSAGGNLAIGLADWVISNGHKAPDKLILLAPWVDLDMSRPDERLSSGEQLLIPDDLRDAGRRYAGDMDVRDPLISPLFGDMLQLPEIHIFTGDQEGKMTRKPRETRLLPWGEGPRSGDEGFQV